MFLQSDMLEVMNFLSVWLRVLFSALLVVKWKEGTLRLRKLSMLNYLRGVMLLGAYSRISFFWIIYSILSMDGSSLCYFLSFLLCLAYYHSYKSLFSSLFSSCSRRFTLLISFSLPLRCAFYPSNLCISLLTPSSSVLNWAQNCCKESWMQLAMNSCANLSQLTSDAICSAFLFFRAARSWEQQLMMDSLSTPQLLSYTATTLEVLRWQSEDCCSCSICSTRNRWKSVREEELVMGRTGARREGEGMDWGGWENCIGYRQALQLRQSTSINKTPILIQRLSKVNSSYRCAPLQFQ